MHEEVIPSVLPCSGQSASLCLWFDHEDMSTQNERSMLYEWSFIILHHYLTRTSRLSSRIVKKHDRGEGNERDCTIQYSTTAHFTNSTNGLVHATGSAGLDRSLNMRTVFRGKGTRSWRACVVDVRE